ncbi:hypothetical protein FRC08_008192 [Ceratobasidium sp. 394]|nr:hypothetical protein FRC08_008192 [Ceratobasidium sp. 394]
MSPGKSKNKPQQNARKFLAAEYMGRKEVVRRSPKYHVTISSIKQAFPKLRIVSVERIAICAFIEELDDTLHVSEHIWHEVLPDLKHITVVLDSAEPDVTESQTVAVTPNQEPSTSSVEQVPPSTSSPGESRGSNPAQPPNTLPATLPPQPSVWGGIDTRNIVIAIHGTFRIWVMTKPSTTIEDLKAHILARSGLSRKCAFHYRGLNISDRKTVGELRLLPHAGNYIDVTSVE